MKTLILAAAAIASLAATALPASADTIVRHEGNRTVVVERSEHRGVIVERRHGPVFVQRHHRERVIYFDRHHHRHVEWR